MENGSTIWHRVQIRYNAKHWNCRHKPFLKYFKLIFCLYHSLLRTVTYSTTNGLLFCQVSIILVYFVRLLAVLSKHIHRWCQDLLYTEMTNLNVSHKPSYRTFFFIYSVCRNRFSSDIRRHLPIYNFNW